MIYLDLPARKRVLGMFHEGLREGGYLFLGHAESLLHITTDFEIVHLRHDLVYRKPLSSLSLPPPPPPASPPPLPAAAVPPEPPPPRTSSRSGPLRVLIAEDSPVTQQFLADRLTCEPDVQVAGRASDGEEALRLALQLRPDLICMDLEVPRMNGFTVLRVLMSKQPAPVIVVSSNARKEDVFKALELGALDFVAKPEAGGDLSVLARELSSKLAMVRALRAPTTRRGASPGPEEPAPPPQRPARLAGR